LSLHHPIITIMAYASDTESYNYTNPSRTYGVLGADYNQQLVPPIPRNPYMDILGGMNTQYQAADPNSANDNGYWTLMKQNNGQPYSTIQGYGYPSLCSYYNKVQCPTNKILGSFPPALNQQTAAPQQKMTTTPYPAVPTTTLAPNMQDLVRFMNNNQFTVYYDPSTAQAVTNAFPAELQPYLKWVDVSIEANKQEMLLRGVPVSALPAFFSASNPTVVYSRVPPSIQDFYVFWLRAANTPMMFPQSSTGAPVQPVMVDPNVKYVVIVKEGDFFSDQLTNAILQNPSYSAMTKIINYKDEKNLVAYFGGPAILTQTISTPTTFNLTNMKNIPGFNPSLGLQDLYGRIQN